MDCLDKRRLTIEQAEDVAPSGGSRAEPAIAAAARPRPSESSVEALSRLACRFAEETGYAIIFEGSTRRGEANAEAEGWGASSGSAEWLARENCLSIPR